MRKLKLDVGALRVQSFDALPGRGRAAGTVRANEGTADCSGEESCGYLTLCQDTCFCADTSPRPSCEECSFYGGC